MKTLKQKHAELCSIIGENETLQKLHSWYDRVLKRERKRRSEVQQSSFDSAQDDINGFCREVLEDLHQRTGITFRLSKATRTSIAARRNDGFYLDDFKKVHEIKCFHWLEDSKMINYLHPSTLYRPQNFDKYLTQWEIWQRDLKRKTEKRKNDKLLKENLRSDDGKLDPAFAQLLEKKRMKK